MLKFKSEVHQAGEPRERRVGQMKSKGSLLENFFSLGRSALSSIRPSTG
jgi:hypothetical protein